MAPFNARDRRQPAVGQQSDMRSDAMSVGSSNGGGGGSSSGRNGGYRLPLVDVDPRHDQLNSRGGRQSALSNEELDLLGHPTAGEGGEPSTRNGRRANSAHHRRNLILGFALTVLVVAGVGTTIGLVWGRSKRDASTTNNPDSTVISSNHSPDLKPGDLDVLDSTPDDDAHNGGERYKAVLDRVSRLSSPASLAAGSKSPQRNALRWIVHFDPAGVEASDPTLVDRYLLTTLFFAMDGIDWHINSRWLVDRNLCSWYGIDCRQVLAQDGTTVQQVITMLALPQNNLGGYLPDELGALEFLQDLNLAANRIGSSLPASIGNLARCETLSLHNNTIQGTLPSSIGNMNGVVNLLLHANDFIGQIPSTLGNLGQLEQLHLYENDFFGTLPRELGKLPNVKRLWLSRNRISGAVPPELGRCVRLECLYLDSNSISGPLPKQLSQASLLADIRLNSNRLTGSIPPEFGILQDLNLLYLDNNMLRGSIPSTFGKLYRLQELALHKNQLQGTVPTDLGELKQLEVLVLGDNKFTGPLPPTLSKLKNLRKLRLYRNGFTGPLPDLSQCIDMDDMELQENAFEGRIPSWLGALSYLKNLLLHHNNFVGPLPRTLAGLTGLERMRLEGNPGLVGGLPDGVCHYQLGFKELTTDCAIECTCCTSCLASDAQMIIMGKNLG